MEFAFVPFYSCVFGYEGCVVGGLVCTRFVEVDPARSPCGIDWREAAVEEGGPGGYQGFSDDLPCGPCVYYAGCCVHGGEVAGDGVGEVLHGGSEVELFDGHVEDSGHVCDEVLKNGLGGGIVEGEVIGRVEDGFGECVGVWDREWGETGDGFILEEGG